MGKIIIGYDENEEARDALALGRELAQITEATVLLAAVFPYSLSWMGGEVLEEVLEADAGRLFADPLLELDAMPVETRAIAGHSPARALHDLATAEEAQMVVIGSSHRGPVGRVLAGSVGDRLLHGAPCPVAVAPRGFASRSDLTLQRIGVGFDGSPEARHALALARELARRGQTVIDLLGVLTPIDSDVFSRYAELAEIADVDQVDASRRARLEEMLARAAGELPKPLRGEATLIEGEDPAAELAAYGKWGIDLLLVGSRGYGPLRRVLLGGVSSKLLRTSPCPVVVTPRGAETALAAEGAR